MKTMKQILAGLLVAVMLVAGLMITPMDAKAAEDTIEDGTGVQYILDTEKYNFMDFWKVDASKRTAPTKENKVFGGWYKKVNGVMTAIKQSEAETITDGAGIYAKFVPAEVLSVRAQLEAGTEANDGANVGAADDTTITKKTTYLRLLSAVNGLDYQKVGFDIWYNKKHQETNEIATNITKVYANITNDETDNAATDEKESIAASSVFGAAATHFSVLRLDDIYKVNFEYVIYVTPQWTTLDGTLVEGQAKYVRVIDGYVSHHYISVPVNFLTGSAVAAGKLEMTYDSTQLEVVQVDLNGYDAGEQKTEGSYYDNEAGTIKFVNNITGTENIEPESVVYANVWFKVKDDETIDDGTKLEFTMSNCSFCNWDENMVDVTPWDFTYLK